MTSLSPIFSLLPVTHASVDRSPILRNLQTVIQGGNTYIDKKDPHLELQSIAGGQVHESNAPGFLTEEEVRAFEALPELMELFRLETFYDEALMSRNAVMSQLSHDTNGHSPLDPEKLGRLLVAIQKINQEMLSLSEKIDAQIRILRALQAGIDR